MADSPTSSSLELAERWRASWPDALKLWSPFVTLRDPVLCCTDSEVAAERFEGGLAMIRLADQTVVINLLEVQAKGLSEYPVELLAHEIGHHILAPANLTANARMLARIRYGLPGCERHAPLIANLWTDLLINDRLHRDRGLDMAALFYALNDTSTGGDIPLWIFYMRTYEILWSLTKGSLARAEITDQTEADALLAARIVRVFARRIARGGGSYAMLALPYLLAAHNERKDFRRRFTSFDVLLDTQNAGQGGFPSGVTELDGGAMLHPLHDPEIAGSAVAIRAGDGTGNGGADNPASGRSTGQYREPFEYGQLLRATGLDISDEEIAIRYYRERSIPHLIPFPVKKTPASTDPLPEGVEIWDVGEPLQEIDWIETLVRSPVVVPGVTSMQRTWGTTSGSDPHETPLDLDIYIDSSGSMPNPQQATSYLALAGTILALSALRAGARVQATLWSGTNQFVVTNGFVRDEKEILGVITGHFGGATAFPIHVMRDTYRDRPVDSRPAHILIVSDNGVDTMFNTDEQGNDGRTVSRTSLDSAKGGGTMVLNLFRPVEEIDALAPAIEDGWDIHAISGWDDLVSFARTFSRRTYVETVS